MNTVRIICCMAVLALAQLVTPASAGSLPRPVVTIGNPGWVEDVGYWRGFHVIGGVHYYNGYRGVVIARPGYRYYGGYWFPRAAFAAGVITSRTIVHPALPMRRLTAAHIRWCLDRYRSYRVNDNTYQPYDGPREQCWSPYD